MRSIDEFDFFLCGAAGTGDTLTPVQGTVRTGDDDTVHLTLHHPESPERLAVPPDTPLADVVRLLASRMA